MTVLDCFKAALGLHGTNLQEDDSLQQYAVGWTNMALGEMLDAQNSILESKNQTPLTTAPTLTSDSDDFPYDDTLKNALIYYMASNVSKDDESNDWAQEYYNRYVTEVRAAAVYLPGRVIDAYGSDY